MKVVSAQEMSRVEKLAVSQGASEEAFMETAGEHVAERTRLLIPHHHQESAKVALLLGHGNNAGDAFVAGRILLKAHIFVFGIALNSYKECSKLAQLQWDRFTACGGKVFNVSEKIDFSQVSVFVDGLFGTGFKGQLNDVTKELIRKVHDSKKPILSIDIPSGVNGSTGDVSEGAICAHETVFLGLPKSGCFYGKAWEHTGRICVRNFGLEDKFLHEAQPEFELLEIQDIAKLLPKIRRTRHKYEAGYVLGMGGSHGMTGAPILASLAALRSGAGIVRLFHPQNMGSEFLAAPIELIRVEGYETLDQEMKRASACFLGPGMGTSMESLELLKMLLLKISKPCVIDADALTLIGKHGLKLPQSVVLTPHHGEMKRLLQITEELPFSQFLDRCRSYATDKNLTLVLKGSPTWIFSSKDVPLISIFGDPGMATAGAGDVLTGIIAACLAEGKSPKEAAMLGVALHGLSGEQAAKHLTSYSLIASDLIEYIPSVIDKLIKS